MNNIIKTLALSTLVASAIQAQTFPITSTDSAAPDEFSRESGVYNIVLTNNSTGKVPVYAYTGNWTARMINVSLVDIDDNVNLTSAYNVSTTSLNVGAGGSLKITAGTGSSAGGLRIKPNTNSIIEGALDILGSMQSGANSWAGDFYLVSIESGTTTFKGNASLIQRTARGAYNNFATAKNKIYGTLNIGTADTALLGTLSYADFVFFTDKNSTLNLYSSNKIISGTAVESIEANKLAGYKNATAQADSVFFVRAAGATGLTMNAFVDNEFGTIDAYTGSTITLNTSALDGSAGKQSLVINKLLVSADTTEEALSLNLLLNLALGESLQIKNFNELLESEDLVLNVKIFDTDSAAYKDAILGKDYAVSSTGWISAIPEPAEWAAIFGVVALAFVAYRRRK